MQQLRQPDRNDDAVPRASAWKRSYNFRECFLLLDDRQEFLSQREMRSVIVIVKYILLHQPPQMALIQDDHMVEQIASIASDPTLGNAVLPRTAEAIRLG